MSCGITYARLLLPDAEASIAAVFEAFAATGSNTGTLRRLLASAVGFAQLVWGGEQAGTIIWCDYTSTASQRADQPGLCWRLCLWPPGFGDVPRAVEIAEAGAAVLQG
jgi:hypothetical protein